MLDRELVVVVTALAFASGRRFTAIRLRRRSPSEWPGTTVRDDSPVPIRPRQVTQQTVRRKLPYRDLSQQMSW